MSKYFQSLLILFLYWFHMYQCKDLIHMKIHIEGADGKAIDPALRDRELAIFHRNESLFISCESTLPHRPMWSKILEQPKNVVYEGTVRTRINGTHGVDNIYKTSWEILGKSNFVGFLGCQLTQNADGLVTHKAIVAGNETALDMLRKVQYTSDAEFVEKLNKVPLAADFMDEANTDELNSDTSPLIIQHSKSEGDFFCISTQHSKLSIQVLQCADPNLCDLLMAQYLDGNVLPENPAYANTCMSSDCRVIGLQYYPPQGIVICRHHTAATVRRFLTGLDKIIYFTDRFIPINALAKIEKRIADPTTSLIVVEALEYISTPEITCLRVLPDGKEEILAAGAIIHKRILAMVRSPRTTSLGVNTNAVQQHEQLKCFVPIRNTESYIELNFPEKPLVHNVPNYDILVITIIICMAVATGIVLILILRRKASPSHRVEDISGQEMQLIQPSPAQVNLEHSVSHSEGPLDENMKISETDVKFTNEICGRGATGYIKIGKYRERIVAGKFNTEFSPGKIPSPKAVKKWEGEVGNHLLVKDCQQVVEIIGFVINQQGGRFIVLGYCSFGSLLSVISKYGPEFKNLLFPSTKPTRLPKQKFKATSLPEPDEQELQPSRINDQLRPYKTNHQLRPFDTRLLVQWSADSASGLDYLQSKKIAHHDVASRNLLIDENLDIKLCDFGRSCRLEDGDSNDLRRLGDVYCDLFSLDLKSGDLVSLLNIAKLEAANPEVGAENPELVSKNLKFISGSLKFADDQIVQIILSCREEQSKNSFAELRDRFHQVYDTLPDPNRCQVTIN